MGQIWAWTPTHPFRGAHPTRWTRSAPRTAPTTAAGIAGRYIVGGQFVDGVTQPVRWVDGRARVLPGAGEAAAVDTRGTVVGRRADFAGAPIWPAGTGPVDLPNPAGLQQAGATAVSDRGTVAGVAFDEASQSLPVLWSCR